MNEKIKSILMNELKYSEYAADVTAQDLDNIQPQLKKALDKWLLDRTISDVETLGFSARKLMADKGFAYPAALIAMDWLLTDPATAQKELSSDIKR